MSRVLCWLICFQPLGSGQLRHPSPVPTEGNRNAVFPLKCLKNRKISKQVLTTFAVKPRVMTEINICLRSTL